LSRVNVLASFEKTQHSIFRVGIANCDVSGLFKSVRYLAAILPVL
jgi:hypothetical protein